MFSPRDMDLPRGWPGRIDGERVVQLAAQTLQAFFTGGGGAREHAEYRLDEVELRPPVLNPPTIRFFGHEGTDFVFLNTASVTGPEDAVAAPRGVHYGLAIAAVVGADEGIGGFTLANAWVAPSLVGAKQRDFALSLGPTLVTELEAHDARVSVNGEFRASAPLAVDWERLRSHAAANTRLRPGDLLVVGLGRGESTLAPGDVVELDADGIGNLRNTIA